MENKILLSVVIPLGNAFDGKAMSERYEALKFAIENFYLKHPAVEIILVCQNFEPPQVEGIKVVRLSYVTFNKGWCINVGARVASGKYLCIAESDMFCYDANLVDTIGFMCNRSVPLKWCFAWSALVYTTEEQRKMIMQCEAITGDLNTVEPKSGMSEGGLVMFERDFFLNTLGGCNEWFEELGGPDNELARRAQTATGTYSAYPQVVYHLWHPKCREKMRPTRLMNRLLYRSTVLHAAEFNAFLAEQWCGYMDSPAIAKKTFRKAWKEYKKKQSNEENRLNHENY